MPKTTGQHWMGVPDAAAYLGVGPRVVYRLIDQGQIPAYKLGRVMRRDDVDAFLDRNRIEPGKVAHLWKSHSDNDGQPPPDAAPAPVDCSGKYRPLWLWLQADQQRERSVSFSEMERLLAFRLPNSSRMYTAHWYSYASSSVARAIIDAGWHVSGVDLPAESVVLAPGPPPRRR